MKDMLITIAPILVNCLVSIISIIIGYLISKHTIDTNKKINIENAGKNRAIYSIEQMDIARDDRAFSELLNKMLSKGEYTILSAFVNIGNTTQTRYILGKIKP